MTKLFCTLIGAVVPLCVTTAVVGVVGGSEPAQSDKRFDCVCAFGTAGGVRAGNNFGSGTLIAPNMVLIAAHLAEPTGEFGEEPIPPNRDFGVRFRRSPDGSIGSSTNPDGFHDVDVVEIRYFGTMPFSGYPANIDAAVAILAEPVTHIEPAHVSASALDQSGPGAPLVVAGWGNRTIGANCQSTRDRGRLRTAQVEATYVSDGLILWPDACVGGAGPALYDSGGAVFSTGCDERVSLVGVIVYRIGGTSVAGISQTPNADLIRHPPGVAAFDYTGDGQVDHHDLSRFIAHFNAGSLCADVDDDGQVSAGDASLIEDATTETPDLCPCDFTGNGILDSDDFFSFVNLYYAGNELAELDGDGVVTEQDFFEFLNCFFQCGGGYAPIEDGMPGVGPSVAAGQPTD